MSTNRTPLLTKEERAQLSADEKAIVDSYENNDAIVVTAEDLGYSEESEGADIDYSFEIDPHYLDQIKDPTHNRPSRVAEAYYWRDEGLPDYIHKVNIRTFAMHEHVPGNNRNTKHKDEVRTHTVKMSASKPPRDPRLMELFFSDNRIGFHWFQRDCKIKTEKKTGIVKYVFPEDAYTDWFFWGLPNGTPVELDALKEFMHRNPLGTLESLTARNEKSIAEQKPIFWNEILIGFPAGKIEAVFATLDERSVRLRAYKAMLHVKEQLGLTKNLPVYVNQTYYAYDPDYSVPMPKMPQREAVFRFYRQDEFEVDLKAEAIDRQIEQSLRDLIHSHRALALVAPDEKMLDYQLEQLTQVDTPTNRPSLSTAFFKGKVPDVIRKVNLKTFDVDNNYHPGQSRSNKPKDYIYPTTIKTEVTVLPTDPAWIDFGVEHGALALIFDYNDCDVKEKYIFQDATQIKMADCAWLNVTDQDIDALKARFKDQPVGDLAAVKARNDKAVIEQQVISPNVLFARVPKCSSAKGVSIRGIVALCDDMGTPLKAWRTMLKIKERFSLAQDLPIAVMQSYNNPNPPRGYSGFRIYRDYERVSDLIEEQMMQTNPLKLAKQIERFYMRSNRLRWQYPMTPAEREEWKKQSRDYVKRLRNQLPLGEQAKQRIEHLKRLAAEQDGFELIDKQEIDTKQESKLDDEYVMVRRMK
jgi:hypothetical protein